MSQYAVDIDLTNPNVSHVQVIDLIGSDKRVLDVGCWNGDLGAVLRHRYGCSVVGVEIDEDAAKVAAERLDKVVVANLDDATLSTLLVGETFDVIVLADVLEHLMDPVGLLRDAATLLAPGGSVVISLPNVTHGSVRLALLQGRWRTTPTGLLDATHIQFFDREGVFEMLAAAGFAASDLRGTTADPLRTEVEIDETELPSHIIEWVRQQPDALVYQFQVRATPAAREADLQARPALVEAVPASRVRAFDKHTEAWEDQARAALRMKDHVIGLQATATSALADARNARVRVRELRTRLRARNRRIDALRARIARLEAEAAATPGRRAAVRSLGRSLLRR